MFRFAASIRKASKSFGNPIFRGGFPKGNPIIVRNFAPCHPAFFGQHWTLLTAPKHAKVALDSSKLGLSTALHFVCRFVQHPFHIKSWLTAFERKATKAPMRALTLMDYIKSITPPHTPTRFTKLHNMFDNYESSFDTPSIQGCK